MEAIENIAPINITENTEDSFFKMPNISLDNLSLDQFSEKFKSPYVRYSIIGVAVLLVIYLCYRIYKRRQYYRANPLFIKNGKDAKIYKRIKQKDIPNSLAGNELTVFCWLNIDDLKYRFGKVKHVLTKGNPYIHRKSQCPSIWIDGKTNDLLVYISNKHFNDVVRVKDVPIQKWFSVAVSIRDNIANIYIDSNLVISKSLRASAKINNGDLHICKHGGFSGNISSLGMFSSALNVSQIKKLHAMGNNRAPYYMKLYNTIKGLFGKVSFSVKVDVDTE